jgi:iron complex outermembrane receptor protein
VTQTNVGGRSTFQNAGATRRRGIELSAAGELGNDLRLQGAYTWLDARYRDPFQTCAGVPCTTPTLTIPADNRIPGTASNSFYASLAWLPPLGWRGGLEARALSKVWVNDANSDAAAGYATFSGYLGYLARIGAFELSGFGRIDNLFDRAYVGSVIVGEGNGRFFEPAPGRTWTVGGSVALRF